MYGSATPLQPSEKQVQIRFTFFILKGSFYIIHVLLPLWISVQKENAVTSSKQLAKQKE